MLPPTIPADSVDHAQRFGNYLVVLRHGTEWWQVLESDGQKLIASVPVALVGRSVSKAVLAAELIAKARVEGVAEGYDTGHQMAKKMFQGAAK